jgi:hypothetical protein
MAHQARSEARLPCLPFRKARWRMSEDLHDLIAERDSLRLQLQDMSRRGEAMARAWAAEDEDVADLMDEAIRQWRAPHHELATEEQEDTFPAPYYYTLFSHMNQEHDLALLDSELADIVAAVDRMRAGWNNVDASVPSPQSDSPKPQ